VEKKERILLFACPLYSIAPTDREQAKLYGNLTLMYFVPADRRPGALKHIQIIDRSL